MAALLPKGGNVLYIQGPSDNSAAETTHHGHAANETRKRQDQHARRDNGPKTAPTKPSPRRVSLPTSQRQSVDMVSAQDDSMALGARKAIDEVPTRIRTKWLAAPFTGSTACPRPVRKTSGKGILAATVVVPPNTTLAIEMLIDAIQNGKKPPELALTVPSSFPPLNKLASSAS